MQATSIPQLQAAIDQYFKAWESQNPALLTTVFTPDAKYVAQPFGVEEYQGLESIKDYWRSKPVGAQVGPRPKIISQAFDENSYFIKELRERYASKETS